MGPLIKQILLYTQQGQMLRFQDFQSPIEFIYAEHDRQFALCDSLERIATDPLHEAARQWAAVVLEYLASDLPVHRADEEESFFPRLLRRRRPWDNIDEILDLACNEHQDDGALCAELIYELGALAVGHLPPDPTNLQRMSAAFARRLRRHLRWENAVVLPFGRKRLTLEDQAELAQEMARRRGVRLAVH